MIRYVESDKLSEGATIFKYDKADGYWECQKCELTWVFTDGDPSENEMVYCPKCGRKIMECVDYVEPWDEDEEDGETCQDGQS